MWLMWVAVAFGVEEFEGHTFVFGDIHSHTGASGDGGSADLGHCIRASDDTPADCGSVADLGEIALANGLDFLATVDHVTAVAATTTAEAFETVFHSVNELHDPSSGFVTLPGAEIFVELPGGAELGHRSLLFFGTKTILSGVSMGDLQPSGSLSNVVPNCAAVSTFMSGVESTFGPALLIPHHPGVDKPMPTDWSCHDPRWAPVVEAYSEHGSSLDSTSGFDPPWSGFAASGTVRFALDPAGHGHRIGLVGGTDNHDTHPGDVCRTDTVLDHHPYGGGLTGAVMEVPGSFDRVGLYEAFRARRTYTTTGPKLPVVLEVLEASGATAAGMGEELLLPPDTGVSVQVRFPVADDWTVSNVVAMGPTSEWELERTEAGRWEAWIPASEIEAYLLIDVVIDGALWFEDGCADGGDDAMEHLWLSPVWFGSPEPDVVDLDDDGVSVEEGDCDDTNPFVFPGAAEACGMMGADHDCDGVPSELDSDCDEPDTGSEPDTGGEPAVVEDSGEPERTTPADPEGHTDEPKSEGCTHLSRNGVHPWWVLAGLGLMFRRVRRS
jgi:hypothetical protein